MRLTYFVIRLLSSLFALLLRPDNFKVSASNHAKMLLQNVIVFTNFLLVFSKNMCTHDEERRAVKNVVPCSLRKTLVPLVKPLELTRIRPDQILIKRCQGSCWITPNTCRAISSKNTSVVVEGTYFRKSWPFMFFFFFTKPFFQVSIPLVMTFVLSLQ